MPGNVYRNECWRSLCEALVEAKRAVSEETRNAHLDEVERWADKLAEITSADGPNPLMSSDYVEAAMDDTRLVAWAIPL